MKRVSAFLDTNIFLHYQPFEQINWPEVLGADEVTLLVAAVVIGELDRHKDGQSTTKRSKERARKVAGRFRDLWAESPVAEIGPGVAIRYIMREPGIDFAAYGLARDWQDDRLLASVIEAGAAMADQEIVLVTRDVGPELRARQFGVRVVRLPERLELQDEPDPSEKRIRELERELNEARNAIPKLCLRFANGEDRLVLQAPERVSTADEWITQRVEAIRRKHPKRDVTSPGPAPKPGSLGAVLAENIELHAEVANFGVQGEEIHRYNRALDAFYADWERYLRDTLEDQARWERTYRIDLELANTGTAPADDIDVFLHFPDGFDLIEESELSKVRKPPRPPRGPRTPMEIALEGFNTALQTYSDPFYMPEIPSIGPPANVLGPRIRRSNSYDVEVTVRRLKHALREAFDPMFVVFASHDVLRPFRIDYRINAANAPREVDGALNVRFDTT